VCVCVCGCVCVCVCVCVFVCVSVILREGRGCSATFLRKRGRKGRQKDLGMGSA
jgi:hypothetical protein